MGKDEKDNAVTDAQNKILIVDDDARLRGLLQRFLEEAGYLVKAVADGEQMDRALSREIYSLMVLDLMLPGEDGLSICRRLREADNPMPVIMLTAKGDDAERIEVMCSRVGGRSQRRINRIAIETGDDCACGIRIAEEAETDR